MRTKLFNPKDSMFDQDIVGFELIEAHEVDDVGVKGMVEKK